MTFPQMKYRTILIDPPWQMDKRGGIPLNKGKWKSPLHDKYNSLTKQEIINLPIDKITENECDMFLWTTHTFLIDALDIPPDRLIPDNNVITSGNHNVGSGETYTTFAAFAADLGSLTGNITGIQTSNITETSTALFQFNYQGYKLTVESDAESYGYPNTGYITSINHTGIGMDFQVSRGV